MPLLVLEHPLIQHKLTLLRDVRTLPKDFRDLVDELSTLMAYEATRHLRTDDVEVETPLQVARGHWITGKVGIVPILRAGLGMVAGMLRLLPMAHVGHIGIYRDHETLEPVEYYVRLPADLEDREILLLDPMLATGGSAAAAVDGLKQRGARGDKIRLLCLLAAPEGVDVLTAAHPDVGIFTASLDDRLNEKGYILPGLGDAGDRLFGTL